MLTRGHGVLVVLNMSLRGGGHSFSCGAFLHSGVVFTGGLISQRCCALLVMGYTHKWLQCTRDHTLCCLCPRQESYQDHIPHRWAGQRINSQPHACETNTILPLSLPILFFFFRGWSSSLRLICKNMFLKTYKNFFVCFEVSPGGTQGLLMAKFLFEFIETKRWESTALILLFTDG